MIILKEYNTPTDVFIFGTVFDKDDFSFTTTDDYDEINFLNQSNFVRGSLDTDGSVSIYTKEEILNKFKENNSNLFEYIKHVENEDDFHFIYLPNYIGFIYLIVEKHIGDGIFKPLITEEFDIKEGCYYQEVKDGKFDYDFCKVYLLYNLKEGAKIKQINKLKEFL